MSLERIEEVKKERGFKVRDLIVYAAVLLLAGILFTAVFLTRNTDPLRGVKISVDGAVVFTYDFQKDEYELSGGGAEVKEEGVKLTVTVRANGGYNVFEILKSERKVRVTEADCRAKTCTYMAINDNNGVIHCAQHHIKAEPFGSSPDGGYIPFG